MECNNNQLHCLLQTSIDQYTEILRLMESITQTNSDFSIEKLIIVGNKILKKQKTATKTDKNLLPLLSEASSEMVGDHTFAKRTKLLKQVIQLNKIITPKLTNIRSLMGSELQQVIKGRSAIKGYQQTEIKHGRNLNNTL